jgi:hypothetical protein
MKNPSIDELLAGFARGEPMDIRDQKRLDVALRHSAALREQLEAQRDLSRRLGIVRDTLRRINSPDRAGLLLSAPKSSRTERKDGLRPLGLRNVAAVVAVALIASSVLLRELLDSRRPSEPAMRSTELTAERFIPGPESYDSGEFVPLSYGADFSSMSSYDIVRVRIPWSSINFVDSDPEYDLSVEADVILGEDGLAKAIRFTGAEIWGRQDATIQTD